MQVKEVEEAFERARRVVKEKKETYARDVESKTEELLKKAYEALSRQQR